MSGQVWGHTAASKARQPEGRLAGLHIYKQASSVGREGRTLCERGMSFIYQDLSREKTARINISRPLRSPPLNNLSPVKNLYTGTAARVVVTRLVT